MKSSKNKSIVVLGSSNTDMIIQMNRLPRPGETVLGGRFSMAAGGKGANQAVGAARAGGAVTFIARIGQDLFGQQALQGFSKDGINVEYIFIDNRCPSGVALIFVANDGENSIAVASGANEQLSPADVKKAKNAIINSEILVMQLETPLATVMAAAEIAQANGVRVILNPAPARPLDDNLLKRISILTPNQTETELLTGVKVNSVSAAARAARALLDRGVQAVLITLGARGVLAATSDSVQLVPGFKVAPVDTTAAGDIFNGALAVALAENKPLIEAARFANAAAALSVTKLGAQPSAPRRKQIERFLRAANPQADPAC